LRSSTCLVALSLPSGCWICSNVSQQPTCPDRFPVSDVLHIGPTDPPEYPWLYAVPGLLFGGGYLAAVSTGMAGLVQAGYLVSSILCISELAFVVCPL
jgi:hypothetical protein